MNSILWTLQEFKVGSSFFMGTLIEKAPKVFAHHWSCLNGRTSSQVSCFLNGVFLPDCPLFSSHLSDFCAKKAKRRHPPSCCDLLAQWRGSFPSEVGGETAVTVDDKKRGQGRVFRTWILPRYYVFPVGKKWMAAHKVKMPSIESWSIFRIVEWV